MLKMLFYNQLYQNLNRIRFKKNTFQNSGFTLIELLLSLAIGSILIMCFIIILNFAIDSCKLGEAEDEILLNGRYAIEYIKKEIKLADKIISTDKIDQFNEKYENNLGFVIMKYIPDTYYKYNYSSYYFKNNRIYRIAANSTNDKLPRVTLFGGHNELAEHIKSIERTSIDFDTKLINLSFELKGEIGSESNFNLIIGIRCPVLY